MKTHDEILSAVLARRDAYLAAKEKRARMACGGVTAVVCCTAVAASVWLWKGSNKPDWPVKEAPTAGTTVTTATPTDGFHETTGEAETAGTVTDAAQSEPTYIAVTTTRTDPTGTEKGTTMASTSRIPLTTQAQRPTTDHASGTGGTTPPTESESTTTQAAASSRYTEIDDPTEEQLPEWFPHVTAFEGEYDLLPGGSWPLGEPLEPQDLWLHHEVRDEDGRYVGEKIVTATFYTVEGWADKGILALKFRDYDTVLYYALQESTDATKY